MTTTVHKSWVEAGSGHLCVDVTVAAHNETSWSATTFNMRRLVECSLFITGGGHLLAVVPNTDEATMDIYYELGLVPTGFTGTCRGVLKGIAE